MILTVLGASGSVPGPGNPCSGYLVEHDGFRLVLDLGTGAFGELLRHLAPGDVDAVVISHRHADHLGDLGSLAYAQEKLPARTRPTRVVAPAGTAALVRRCTMFSFGTARPGEIRLGPLRVRLARVRHPVETYAVRVEGGGTSLVYTADSGPCRHLVELARGADVLLAEAALGAGGPLGSATDWHAGWEGPPPHHLTAHQAGELAALAGVRLLVLTHLRPWDPVGRSLAAAGARHPGPTVAAAPGLRLVTGGAPTMEEPEG